MTTFLVRPPSTVYLSGPISNMPNYNRDQFESAASYLLSAGYTVVNPLELITNPETEWAECMKIDLIEMLRCDAVMVLPMWEKSRGARLEVHVALELDIPVMTLDGHAVDQVPSFN